jgi:hypothetical protein
MNEICLMFRRKKKKKLLKGLSTDPVRSVERGKIFLLSIGPGSFRRWVLVDSGGGDGGFRRLHSVGVEVVLAFVCCDT